MQKKKTSSSPSAEERALDRFADMMIKKISSFKGEWKKPWFTEGSYGMAKNLSGRRYNGFNAFMLLLHCQEQGYTLPYFATFNRIVNLNHQSSSEADGEVLPKVMVKKGESSFPVFLTLITPVHNETKEKISMEDYNNLSKGEKEKYTLYYKFRVYNVFNVDQTNLKEARPELYQKLKDSSSPKIHQEGESFVFEPMDRLIEEQRWICPIHLQYQDRAFYRVSAKEITLPTKEQFVNGESFYGTAFHEMAHSTGAEEYYNRFNQHEDGAESYAKEELVAEMTAALVCQEYGMTKTLKEDSVAYLSSWLKNLEQEPSYIKNVLLDVKRASSLIYERVGNLDRNLYEEEDEQLEESISRDAQSENQHHKGFYR